MIKGHLVEEGAAPDRFTAEAVVVRERSRLAIELAALQAQLEADAAPRELATITVDDDGSYEIVTALRGDVRTQRVALVKLRQDAAGPWKKVATTIEEMFRPAIRAAETIEADFKGKLEAYQMAKAKRERDALAAATAAAQADDSEALVVALTESAALAHRPAGGGSVTKRWVRKRIAPELLPDEWWTPDLEKIDAVAKAHKGDDPPVIPGVIFEQAVSVAVKK